MGLAAAGAAMGTMMTGTGATAGLGMAGQVGGAMLGAFGSYNQAKGQQGALDYEAQVARNNATLADYQAGLTLQNGQVQEENQRLKTAAMFGTQRAGLAANGVDLGSGSANEVLATTSMMGERDALTIRDNAARQAWAYRNQAASYGAEASAAQASADAINPFTSAAGSLLTGAGSVASSWYKYNKSVNGSGTGATNLSSDWTWSPT